MKAYNWNVLSWILSAVLIVSQVYAQSTPKLEISSVSFTVNTPETIYDSVISSGEKININQNSNLTGSSSGKKFVLNYRYIVLGGNGAGLVNEITPQTTGTDVSINGDPLFYPNPLRQSGTETNFLQYELVGNPSSMEVRFFDMRGYEFYRNTYVGGQQGALEGFNKLVLDSSTFNGRELPAGPYFFLVLYQGKVLGKGKFAVRP